MTYPYESIRTSQKTGQIVFLRNIARGPIEATVPQLELWTVSDNGASEAFNMYETNGIWTRHGLDQGVNTNDLVTKSKNVSRLQNSLFKGS